MKLVTCPATLDHGVSTPKVFLPGDEVAANACGAAPGGEGGDQARTTAKACTMCSPQIGTPANSKIDHLSGEN